MTFLYPRQRVEEVLQALSLTTAHRIVLKPLSVRSFTSNHVPLQMVDLRESGCLIHGAPTDTAHALNQSAGRALGCALYEQHADIDGIGTSLVSPAVIVWRSLIAHWQS